MNVSATVTYDRKELLDIRASITHLLLEEFIFNESDGKELLQTPDKALIPVIPRWEDTEILWTTVRVSCQDPSPRG
jgi:hypothetical protein